MHYKLDLMLCVACQLIARGMPDRTESASFPLLILYLKLSFGLAVSASDMDECVFRIRSTRL